MPVAPKADGSALMQLALSCESPQVGVGAFEFAAWRAYSHPSTLQGSCSGTLCQRTASTCEMTEPMVLGLIPKLPSISSLLFMLYVATAQSESSGTRASAHPDPDPDPELRIKSPNSVPDPSVPDHRMHYLKSDVELGVRSIPVPYPFQTKQSI